MFCLISLARLHAGRFEADLEYSHCCKFHMIGSSHCQPNSLAYVARFLD